MTKLTLESLRALREKTKREIDRRDTAGKTTTVLIGMGTCGIAAGAKGAFDAFLDEIERNNLSSVVVKQTGCMGLCHSEPTVEVRMPGMPDIIYGRVDGDTARRIVQEHLLHRRLIDDHVFDKPAADLAAVRS
ncbi:MAG: (2Fe-2S) ferredoxin domain-containing protein [Kiritimatiellia bacterium]|nr:(2Fe-2S) ferredoxin domain-containing protein [Kiritimatiellia bacterium]